MIEATQRDRELAALIVRLLRLRNGGELDPAFAAMRVSDFELLLGELARVLHFRGRPPNWSPEAEGP